MDDECEAAREGGRHIYIWKPVVDIDYKGRVLLVPVRPYALSQAACLVSLHLLRGAATSTTAKPRLFYLRLRVFGRTTALSGRNFTRGSVGSFLALDGIVNDGGISKLEVIWHLWRSTTLAFLAGLGGGSGSAAGRYATSLHGFEGFFILGALGTPASTLWRSVRSTRYAGVHVRDGLCDSCLLVANFVEFPLGRRFGHGE